MYQYNHFEASRYDLKGAIALHGKHHEDSSKLPIQEHLLRHLHDLQQYTKNHAKQMALQRLRHMEERRLSDAGWLRQIFTEGSSLNDMMRLSPEL